ncbi:ATP-binding protein [Actinoallomurus sp. CA-142502]|uniref:ATP-binding protein n=1 Tax=Actinoallomurus sp. CA-142502 TaxID=3239885 RepID=UPI003D8BD5A6
MERLFADTRLLSLIGPGGVGKTRLALRAAAKKRRAFADGVWLVDLSPLRGRGLLIQEISTALGLRDASARSSVSSLVAYLQDKHLLLVLDNCEHLLDECAKLVDTLLAGASGLTVLATSREPLNIRGERVLGVPPLAMPCLSDRPKAEAIIRCDAVRLFADRAALVAENFAITAENCGTVAKLCQRLDGMPLAIELATVRLRMLSVEQILERIEDRFHLLAGRDRTALPRHQTLRAAIDWSYELCSPQERMLWERLSVFSGECDLQAAEQVCAGGGIAREDVLDLVAGLVDKSILIREGHGQARYRLLETIRVYGYERLAQSGEEEAFRRAHHDYYRDMSGRAEREWFGPRQLQWLERIRLEMSNLRVALEFCMSGPGEVDVGLEIAAALRVYWIFYGSMGEARHWLDRALGRPTDQPSIKAKALLADAFIALLQGNIDDAVPMLDEASTGHARDPRMLTSILFVRGTLALFRGDTAAAIALLQEASGPDDAGDAFHTSLFLAMAAVFDGDDRGTTYSVECRSRAEDAEAEWAMTWGSWVLGLDAWRRGAIPDAVPFFRDSLWRQRRINDKWGPTWNIEGLAWVAAAAGDHERAALCLDTARRLRESIGVSIPQLLPFSEAHKACEARVRESLGQQGYLAAIRRGAGLELDQAIDYVLGEDDLLPGASAPSRDAASPLTPREQQVAELIAQGKTNKEIAASLVIAQRTAEAHVENILVKLGYTSRAEVVMWMTESKHT